MGANGPTITQEQRLTCQCSGCGVEKELGQADYEAMLSAQGGCCAICRKSPIEGQRLAVDHNHATGAVRGLLCTHCNTMLGYAKEDEARMLAGIEYLKKHSGVSHA
jgi:hypothetical protein